MFDSVIRVVKTSTYFIVYLRVKLANTWHSVISIDEVEDGLLRKIIPQSPSEQLCHASLSGDLISM
jgi:hypothetical protein